VLADSDIRVPVGYLDRVTAPLADPQVGIVTCLYRGFGRTGAWSRFGAGFISDWFAPSVRLAHRFGGSRFAFGATIALRRATLDAIGGFAPLRDVLADDFWLGELTRQRGLSTVLSEVVVTTDVVESDFSALWNHEVRWMRTIRSLAPVGFTGLFVTCTFPLVLAGLCLARTPLAWGLAAAGAVARLAAPVLAERGIERRRALRRAWFAPARDTLLLLEWAAAHARTSVRWRGQRFRVWPKPRTPLT
jgi:ceramide glucosyltransferase